VAMAIIAFLVALVLIAGRLIYGHEWAVSGIFTLFSLVFFFLGGQLFAIGLLGENVGRIYQQVRDRPRYVIRQLIRGETNS
jgi:undecaprenyl-phosphate 4-deoxy-4-formamido-L-arabinose transferase